MAPWKQILPISRTAATTSIPYFLRAISDNRLRASWQAMIASAAPALVNSRTLPETSPWRANSDAPKPDYLAEYARHCDCVEDDQWFWSLFGLGYLNVILVAGMRLSRYSLGMPLGAAFGFALALLWLRGYSARSRTRPERHAVVCRIERGAPVGIPTAP